MSAKVKCIGCKNLLIRQSRHKNFVNRAHCMAKPHGAAMFVQKAENRSIPVSDFAFQDRTCPDFVQTPMTERVIILGSGSEPINKHGQTELASDWETLTPSQKAKVLIFTQAHLPALNNLLKDITLAKSSKPVFEPEPIKDEPPPPSINSWGLWA